MPKIPNYTPIHEEEPYGGYKWEHETQDGMSVQVTKNISTNEDADDAYWRAEIWDYAHMRELGPLSKNKEDIRKVAVEWMRDNPDGWEHKD